MSNTWTPVQTALAAMQNLVSPITDTESIDLYCALDRVLAESVFASINVPGFDNSAMDGYAVRAVEANTRMPLQVVGNAYAGHSFVGELPAASCVRIMTGAQLPTGTDAVIMQEQVERTDEQIICQTDLQVGDNVRLCGSDIKQGNTILTAGQRLTAVHLGLLASIGIAHVKVVRKLKVALFSNGDELIQPGQSLPSSSHLYDSNRFVLNGMLQRLNVEIHDLGHIPDDPKALEDVFKQAMQSADVVISSAGVSVGDADFTKDVMSKLGHIEFWKIAMKPGKPFAFGKLGSSWFCGLPGNPVAAVVTMNQIVQPMLRHLAGEQCSAVTTFTAEASCVINKRPGRTDFQRGYFEQKEGKLFARPVGSQSSAVLTSVARANCFIILEQDRGSVSAGESVTIQPFDRFMI